MKEGGDKLAEAVGSGGTRGRGQGGVARARGASGEGVAAGV